MSCRTLHGDIQPPGGFLYENDEWAFFLQTRPCLVAGQGYIILKRHCESVAELSLPEQQSLGVMMTRTADVLTQVVHAQKVHFGLYAESVKHIHLHVTPRTAALPVGNIPLIWREMWLGVLERVKLHQPVAAVEVEGVAQQLKAAFEGMG